MLLAEQLVRGALLIDKQGIDSPEVYPWPDIVPK